MSEDIKMTDKHILALAEKIANWFACLLDDGNYSEKELQVIKNADEYILACALLDSVKRVEEEKRLRIMQGIGWAYADCCHTLDGGNDPRKTDMADVQERALKDLLNKGDI